ncbi:MAG: hypothetical protein H6R26_326 [Proteobacteria bacterium]|nr:hypothetical protein [Pseudomonadota bacterium]
MTAFASTERQAGDWLLSWEIRSVNHRYLDIALRLPELFRFLESEARGRISAFLKRGRLDVSLTVKRVGQQAYGIPVDLDLVHALLAAATRVESISERELAPFSALDVLRWPGVLNETELDRDSLGPGALSLLDETLTQVVEAREVEGRQLVGFIGTRCQQMREHVLNVRQRMPEVLAAMRQKILSRLAELAAKPDVERIEQEMVYLAQKWDVEEELDRLDSHLRELERALEQTEPAGRRLDFLLQEMNREANTLGSKSVDAETTRASVALKVLIEQIREQVQNVE